MSAAGLLGVALAGALGAVLRAELTRADTVRRTALLNVLGAAGLGVASATLDGVVLLVVGPGLLGATTTFSTWMVHAAGARSTVRAVLGPLLLGVAAAGAGRAFAMLLA